MRVEFNKNEGVMIFDETNLKKEGRPLLLETAGPRNFMILLTDKPSPQFMSRGLGCG
jgi:hypothetical protein